jgi:hypothetical protein
VTAGEKTTAETRLVESSEEKSPSPLWTINLFKSEKIDSYTDKVHTPTVPEEGPCQVVTSGMEISSLPQDCQYYFLNGFLSAHTVPPQEQTVRLLPEAMGIFDSG